MGRWLYWSMHKLFFKHKVFPTSQIYVEIERARLTKTLANIKEQSGDVKEAASILQELQVTCWL